MRKIKKQNVTRQIVLGRTLLNEAKLGKNWEITLPEFGLCSKTNETVIISTCGEK